MKHSKELQLVIKDGILTAIYDDALRGLIDQASSVETLRASHVEPDERNWYADMSPVGGPVFTGFTTRTAALDAERRYINQHLLREV